MSDGRVTAAPAPSPVQGLTDPPHEALIRFDDVTVRFGARLAVDHASMALREGRTLGIVGESGSGKTTCVRMALGLQRPSEGRMWFRDRVYPTRWRDLRAIRRHVGFVFQDPYDSLDPRMTIGDIVAEPLRAHGLGGADVRDRVASMLDAIGLPDAPLDSHPSRYSGGGRQRIAIARGLILDPDVLVCDEPTASLDVSVQAQIVNLLLSLKRSRNISVIFVSHDLDLVRRMADDIVVMYAGRVLEAGPAQVVAGRPQHPYTSALLSAVPGDHPRARKLAGRARPATDDHEAPRDHCIFEPRCDRAAERCRSEAPVLGPASGGVDAACFYPLTASVPGEEHPRSGRAEEE